jgi:DNA-directed RNA polymerase specialized sigma24 family protein
MLVPKGYTEEQVLETINKILSSMARKYTFGVYGIDDIKQEGFILAMDALGRYNGSAPLENFLRIHLNNRLKDFKRDNSYRINSHCNKCDIFNAECDSCCKRQQTQDIKKNLLNPIDIHVINDDQGTSYDGSLIDTMEMIEIVDKINKKLPVEYRADYLKIKEGIYVPKARKLEIESIVAKIVDDEYE